MSMTIKIKDAFTFLKKSKIKAGEGLENGLYPFFTSSSNLSNYLDSYEVEEESLILGTGGSASLHHSYGKFSTSTDCFVLQSNNKYEINLRYVFLYLDGNIQILENGFKGAGLKHISKKYLEDIDIPFPPLEIQKKTVEVFDKAQGLIDARKEQSNLMNELIQSVFFEMFGDPLSNSKGWKTTSLDNVSKLERGKFSPRPRNDPQYFGGKYPYIQTGDISKSDNRLISYTQTLNEKGGAVSKEFVAGTIVIAIVGATIGATALLCIDVYAPDSVIGISVDDTVCNNIFLEMQLRCMRQWLLDIAPEGARANINLRILSQLRVIVPPIDKQSEFAEIVNVIEEQKNEIVQRLEDLIVLKNSLEKTLFPKK